MSSALAPAQLTYALQPSAPALKLPPGACDAHVHVFGPADRFPYAAGRNFTPVDAPKETLFALHRKMGIARCVIVQSAVHGFDNAVVEDAIRAGAGRYLGIALVPVDVADAELARLATAGFRGVRFNFMGHLPAADPQDILALAQRLRPLDLHLQIHCHADLLEGLGEWLVQSPVPVVIDHIGRVDAAQGARSRAFIALEKLLRQPGFHVKVSGVDRIDPRAPYGTGVALARLLVESHPEQCLWGSDWPHPNHTHVPDDGVLVDALARIAPNPVLRHKLLVANPERLYRFQPEPSP